MEPFPISRIAERYLLFDVDIVSYARRAHNICGVLIGTIPHLSQQNIFLGIPLELMPEEALLLVEGGHAYIVEDAEMHRDGFLHMPRKDRLAFMQMMDERGAELSLAARKKAEERSEKALQNKGIIGHAKAKESKTQSVDGEASKEIGSDSTTNTGLFDVQTRTTAAPSSADSKPQAYQITPTTSYPPLSPPAVPTVPIKPVVPRTYPLFRYLHAQGYFMTPGLRFGCNYTVYPGDPLRFHSHFLATGVTWDEEFDLLDIVGGGRLGTGVKKAYLIGGEKSAATQEEDATPESGQVRAFSIEWAGI